MAPKASSSRSRSRSRRRSMSELAYRDRVAHELETLRSRAQSDRERIASLERQCDFARIVVGQLADVDRSQEDRFQELCGRVDDVARVSQLQHNRFIQLRHRVDSLSSILRERATQAEREASALRDWRQTMRHCMTHSRVRILELDTAFSSLWSRYIHHLSSTRDILEACEGISAATYREGITGCIPCGLLRAARNSVPDESNPDPLVLSVLGLPLQRSAGPVLAAVAEADTASREAL